MDDVETEFFTRRQLFERTGNPLHAWAAYRVARDHRRPVPDWALEYLDGAADRLLETERDPLSGEPRRGADSDEITSEQDANRKIARALSLESPGRGKAPRVVEFARHEFDLKLAWAVSDLLSVTDTGADFPGRWKAAQVVASEHGVSADRVRRAFERFGFLVGRFRPD